MNPRCQHCWHYWGAACVATFTYLELRGFRRQCHRTLSREIHVLLRSDQCRWSPLVIVALAGALARHIAALEPLPDRPADGPA